jgi:hypothetical protein
MFLMITMYGLLMCDVLGVHISDMCHYICNNEKYI